MADGLMGGRSLWAEGLCGDGDGVMGMEEGGGGWAYQSDALFFIDRALLFSRRGGSHWSRVAWRTTQVRRRLHVMLVTKSRERGHAPRPGGRASHLAR